MPNYHRFSKIVQETDLEDISWYVVVSWWSFFKSINAILKTTCNACGQKSTGGYINVVVGYSKKNGLFM